ncbi:aminopeptidase [Tissierella sp. MSJ-40]|uniref:Aminopeptidase n=1 Tax=Tissierella simiarum TaxID=2841534 RepID=A0ABS6E8U6_9FIRM|nr:aminopeptidase [Tissierella simiarum]MBU5438850.1 aminopeptidase [Tissierella simiarum]
MEFISLIPNICEGFPFEKGDFVLLNFWGDNEDLEILDLISENLSKKGIIPFTHHCSKKHFEKVVLNLLNNDVGLPQKYADYLSSFESVIDIFMYKPSFPKDISENNIPKFKKYLLDLFNSLTNEKKYYIQLTVPTEENAVGTGIEYDVYSDSLCNALSVDFQDLKKSCKDKIDELKNKNSIEILTGKKHSLKLDINNRQWYSDDGCGDFPPGEVYIAPIENNSNGNLLIPLINLNGQKYKDVLMTFENGNLIKCSSEDLEKFFNSLPENFRILCEFGIGLNPKVKELIGFAPIDEKALGTYHIALGMNNLFGGENDCPFHMDFVFTCDNIIFN